MMNIDMFKDQTIAIMGGSGSWGRELTRQLILKEPKEITIFSRGEISQVDMERTFNNPLVRYVIGDIRDKEAVDKVMQGVDYVFQLAALKHVPICENQPHEAILTNIYGVINLINSAIKHKVKKFIDVSTDKAADPSNLYGMTKAIGEKLTIQANCQTKNTEFICVRGGNVLGTNGSLVPYVINQIRYTNKVKVTNDKMTRFFITLPEAIELLFIATEHGIGGETYIMNMPSFKIIDLVDLLVNFYGSPDTRIEITGSREGEKLHEVLITEQEGDRARVVNKDLFVIYPQIKTGRNYFHQWDAEAHWNEATGLMNILHHKLTSEDNLKDRQCLTELLKKGGWL
jgi:UDP-N-acetylglucosamine 4,6-dehydratase/5-epimerase